MISAVKSQARAIEWTVRAERAPVGPFKLRFERIARNWAALAAMARADEALEWRPRRGGR
jgi:hypothetical protein